MPTKKISGAVAADVVIALALDPPVRGCEAGAGLRTPIPADWFARCNAGQAVPGCNYSQTEADGTMYVSDVAQSRTGNPAFIGGLNAGQLTAFIARLGTSVVVP